MNLPSNNQPQPPSFNDFMRSMTPESAKAQLDQMVKSGQLTENQLQQAIEMARQFAPRINQMR
jgi:hypothetical protein